MAQGVTVDFNANLARFSSGIDKATNDLSKFQSNVSRIGQNITKTFGALGVGLSAAAFAGFIKSGIDAADQLNDLAKKTGTTVEQLAGLKFAAEQNGASMEAVATASKKLSVSLFDKPEIFRRFGITAKDTTGAMVQLADIFAAMPDGAEKTALAIEVLGRSGEEMIPFLNEGGASLQKFIERGKELNPITTEMAKQADLFNDQLNELGANAKGAGISIASALLPAMNSLLGTFNKFGKSGGLAETVELSWLDDMMRNAAIKFSKLEVMVEEFSARITFGKVAERHQQAARDARANLDRLIKEELDAPIKGAQASFDKAFKNRTSIDVGNEGKGSELLSALGADKPKKEKPFTTGSRSEFVKESIEGYIKEWNKSKEVLEAAMGKQQDRRRDEIADQFKRANEILSDVDPIHRATEAWNDLIETQRIVGEEMLSNEAIQASFAKSFGDIVKPAKEAFDQMTTFAKRAGENIQDSFAEFLFDPFKDGLGGMLENFSVMVRRMAAEAAAARILESIGGWGKSGGGAGSFLGGLAASVFGGARADGGSVAAGKSYLVGERGPEIFTPGTSGNITPNGAGQPIMVTNNFTISGQVDRATQNQIANTVYASMRLATARNG